MERNIRCVSPLVLPASKSRVLEILTSRSRPRLVTSVKDKAMYVKKTSRRISIKKKVKEPVKPSKSLLKLMVIGSKEKLECWNLGCRPTTKTPTLLHREENSPKYSPVKNLTQRPLKTLIHINAPTNIDDSLSDTDSNSNFIMQSKLNADYVNY